MTHEEEPLAQVDPTIVEMYRLLLVETSYDYLTGGAGKRSYNRNRLIEAVLVSLATGQEQIQRMAISAIFINVEQLDVRVQGSHSSVLEDLREGIQPDRDPSIVLNGLVK